MFSRDAIPAAVVVVAEGDAPAAVRPEAGNDPVLHSHAGTNANFPFQLGESGENADHRFSVGTSVLSRR